MKTRRAKPPSAKVNGSRSGEAPGLTQLALRACLIASDAAFNIRDFLTNDSHIAFLAVRDCERELDRIEQQMDQQLPVAITHVDELEARELLACLRFSTELERIGDLAKNVFFGVYTAIAYKLFMSVLGLWKDVPTLATSEKSVFPNATLNAEITPEYLAALEAAL
jgi:hypothetical protein